MQNEKQLNSNQFSQVESFFASRSASEQVAWATTRDIGVIRKVELDELNQETPKKGSLEREVASRKSSLGSKEEFWESTTDDLAGTNDVSI